jgi:glucose uptake protein
MLVIASYELAVLFCVVTMICWGSWANMQKLAPKDWGFQLFYWDYAIGVLAFLLLLALTAGSYGETGRSFLDDIGQADGAALQSAFIGGVVFNLANLLLVAAISLSGMAVAFPVGIGIALVLGVAVNFVADPVGNPYLVATGVALVLVAILLDAVAYHRIKGAENASSAKGLILSVVAGALMGFFYRFVADAMATDWVRPEAGMLTPYSALVVFGVGLLVSSFVFNTYLMYRPLAGDATSFAEYRTKGTAKIHLVGILGGAIWALGMALSILASSTAGFAISYGLGQGATMVAAAWGVFVWREFANGPPKTNVLLAAMFASFIAGLALIILARLA